MSGVKGQYYPNERSFRLDEEHQEKNILKISCGCDFSHGLGNFSYFADMVFCAN